MSIVGPAEADWLCVPEIGCSAHANQLRNFGPPPFRLTLIPSIGAEHNLACIARDEESGDGRRSCANDDRELIVTEPGGQPIRLCVEDKPGDSGDPSAVADGSRAGKLRLRSPFDEERKRGLCSGLVHPGASPPQLVTARCGSRPNLNSQT